MTYEELVQKVREATRNAVVSKAVAHVAYQFNVEGEAEGAFYVELSGGKINVEPYEYYDRDLIIVTTAEVLLKMVSGELQPMCAYASGQLRVYGDEKILQLLPFGKKKECMATTVETAVNENVAETSTTITVETEKVETI